MARRKRDPKKEALVKEILDQYQPESVGEMQNALKDIFGPMFEAMLQGEMNEHLGYESNTREEKEGTNRRNGYSSKTLKTSYGAVPIAVPRDREANFDPKVIPKRSTNVYRYKRQSIVYVCKGDESARYCGYH